MIGFFDSGVGGLTVLRSVHELMPQYATIYLGDNARAPYGTKTHDEITQYTWEGVRWLFEQGCGLVIVACNSASAQALREIQQTKLSKYPKHRVLGVIRPSAEELVDLGYDRVGILATPATVASGAYSAEMHKLDPGMVIDQMACPDWVPIVEQGIGSTEHAKAVIDRDVKKFLTQTPLVEAVLLGCTHYPALFSLIREALPESIQLFEQGPIVAKKLFNYLERHPDIDRVIDRSGGRQYFTTGDPQLASVAAKQISGMEPTFKKIDLGTISG